MHFLFLDDELTPIETTPTSSKPKIRKVEKSLLPGKNLLFFIKQIFEAPQTIFDQTNL